MAFLFVKLGSHFWPFTDVLRNIWQFVTRKGGKRLKNRRLRDKTNRFLAGVRREKRFAIAQQIRAPSGRALPMFRNQVCVRVIRATSRRSFA